MELLIFIVPVAALWFLLLRPQQRRAKERAAAIAEVKEGDEVVTIGGFIALVIELEVNGDPDLIRLELADGVQVMASRRAIGEVRPFVESDDVVDTTATDGAIVAAGDGGPDAPAVPGAKDDGVGDAATGADGESADRG